MVIGLHLLVLIPVQLPILMEVTMQLLAVLVSIARLPEPASILMLLAGAGAVLAVKRLKK